MGSTALGVSILVWTLLAWGGRIRLLTSDEADRSNYLRIGGSLLVGSAAAGALLLGVQGWLLGVVLGVFVLWTVVLWSRSMVVNWTGSGSLPFKVVHTVLAVGFGILVWFAASHIAGA